MSNRDDSPQYLSAAQPVTTITPIPTPAPATKRLSNEAITGIVIGAFILIFIILLIIFMLRKKKIKPVVITTE